MTNIEDTITINNATIQGTKNLYVANLNEWPSNINVKPLNTNNIQDCYCLVFYNLLKENREKQEYYQTLLKMNNEDFRLTVLQIETGENLCQKNQNL